MSDNIKSINGGPSLQASVNMLRESLPHLMEHHKMVAAVQRVKFLELKKQGFDDAQAVELCKDII